jgi:RNA polymerase sigma factor (sigma-70 family)
MSDAAQQVTARDSPVHEDGGDAALIARSIGTPDCFAGLFDRHAPAIYRYVARRLGPDAADDLVAEAFLVAFERRGRYDSAQADARPWLYGIATNLISRHRRDEIRFFRAIARTGVSPAAEPVADQVTERIAAQALRGQLAAALGALSGANRDTLLLVASGLSHEEVATALRVPVGTVASRLARARKKLRSALGGVSPAHSPPLQSAGTARADLRSALLPVRRRAVPHRPRRNWLAGRGTPGLDRTAQLRNRQLRAY